MEAVLWKSTRHLILCYLHLLKCRQVFIYNPFKNVIKALCTIILVWMEHVKGINFIELQENFRSEEDEKLRKMKHFPGA